MEGTAQGLFSIRGYVFELENDILICTVCRYY